MRMAIQQTKKQSDLEKRLSILRQQVYGKSESVRVNMSVNQTQNAGSIKSDTAFLYKDLLKIIILSTAAIGIEFILFSLSKNHILNLNLF